MIYLREINQNNITLAKGLLVVSAILFIALIIRFVRHVKFGTEDKYLAPLAKTIICLLMFAITLELTKETHVSVPLSEIDNKISVKGQRVDIGELDEAYRYQNFQSGNESIEMSSDSHTFKFDYDEIFETGTLTDRYGRKYELNKEDSKYLKERDGK